MTIDMSRTRLTVKHVISRIRRFARCFPRLRDGEEGVVGLLVNPPASS